MTYVVTVLVDLALFFGAFTSVFLATCWGELCGIRPGRDKSGLGGFAFVYLFMLIRWPLLLLGLLVAHARDGLAWLPATGGVWWLLGTHLAMGVVSAVVFSRAVDHVHGDRIVGRWLGVLLGVLWPLPALTVAIVGVNARWLGADSTTSGVVIATLLSAHWLPFRRRWRGMATPA